MTYAELEARETELIRAHNDEDADNLDLIAEVQVAMMNHPDRPKKESGSETSTRGSAPQP